MTRLYHQFLQFLAEKREDRLNPRVFDRLKPRIPKNDNTVRDAQGNPYGSPEYNMQPKPRIVRTNEQREEYIRPEDQEARNKARSREKAEEQHYEKVREIRKSTQNSSEPHSWDTGSDNSRNMIHDVLFHHDGKVHIKTDLNTGKTSVTHEKDTLEQKKSRHDAEVKKQQASMGSHVIDHTHGSGSFRTYISPVNKDGTVDHRKAKLVKTDHVTGKTTVT